MITVEQIVNTQTSNIDTLAGLAGKAFEGVEKLVELNLSAMKAAMSEAEQTAQAVLSIKDAQEPDRAAAKRPASRSARRSLPTAAPSTRSLPRPALK